MKKKNTISGKMIKVTALVALCLGSILLKANGGKEAAIETERTIKEHVTFPKLILPVQQQNQKVEVIFTTGNDGKVNFVLAKTDNKDIKSEVEKQFSQLTLNKLKANVAYSVVLNIKTI
jgi:hypothetical protein